MSVTYVRTGRPILSEAVVNPFVPYILMGVFFAVIGAVPIAWYLLGLKTYGTGDYHQP
jgi:hypothetical protein